MSLVTTTALCLRKIAFSETSQILTLLTDKLGTVGAIAKGAKREKSSVGGPMDLMCLYQTVLYDRTRRQVLSILAQAELLDFFPALRMRYAAFQAAECLRELLLSFEITPQDAPSLLLLAVRALREMQVEGREQPALARFALGALRALGVEPALDHCVVSGREPSGRVEVAFSVREMGLLSPPFSNNRGDLVRLRPATLAALRAAAEGTSPALPVDAWQGAFRLLAWLLAQQGGKRLKTVQPPEPAHAL
ncbi:MAG: DNA repair protein RecO [Planctomycetes bacterium]|nr:DNA repair protein RecO [Planctomycetota bacterium]